MNLKLILGRKPMFKCFYWNPGDAKASKPIKKPDPERMIP